MLLEIFPTDWWFLTWAIGPQGDFSRLMALFTVQMRWECYWNLVDTEARDVAKLPTMHQTTPLHQITIWLKASVVLRFHRTRDIHAYIDVGSNVFFPASFVNKTGSSLNVHQ